MPETGLNIDAPASLPSAIPYHAAPSIGPANSVVMNTGIITTP